MSDIAFLRYKKKLKAFTWMSYSLLAFGIANCVSSLYLTTDEKSAMWPLLCVIIGVVALLVIQQKLERHEQ